MLVVSRGKRVLTAIALLRSSVRSRPAPPKSPTMRVQDARQNDATRCNAASARRSELVGRLAQAALVRFEDLHEDLELLVAR